MAAEPILASSLWSAESPPESTLAPNKSRKLATGCSPIDDSLNGGFDYGSIACISAEADSGGKELSYSLIASHLLRSGQSEATVVDTTNSFDVRRLHKRIVAGLRETASGDDVKDEAVRMLEQARIMKAFDFVGMTECVAELRECLETRSHLSSSQKSSSGKERVPAPRGTVGDSEDEDDMLDAPTSPEKLEPPPIKEGHDGVGVADCMRHLLIIDNITYVTSPILKNSHVQGQALLTTFMRSLAHLTRMHDVCTIIHNTAITYSGSNPATEPTPSIFSSCALRPALGKSFAYLLDLHLLLHRVPLSAADAKIVYAAHGAIPKSDHRLASVLEVMQVRNSDRVGHWSFFRADAEGKLAAVSV